MGRVSWLAAPGGAYWIDVLLGHLSVRLLVDTGLTDPRNQLGFALEPGIYDQLKQGGQLTHFRTRISRDASGRYVIAEAAETSAQLFDPGTAQQVGPAVRLFVVRGALGVPSRVGIPFFHHLKGCKVAWDLDSQRWSIEYV